ncbi:MAG TPA: GNAT family N-acetyltransferase [Dehalococcoidia bacterium]|nr:GNAT family N-acetyltransferase [Dehalococcoidia bacterium]
MIRPCQGTDLPRICEIINDAATAYQGVIPDDCYHEPYMPMDELRREAAAMTFFGLEEDRRLIGVIGYQPIQDVTLVRHLYVQTDRQRRGVGSALLRHVIGHTDTPRLLVGTWAGAAWAIRFYHRHGFSLLPDGDLLLRTYWSIPDRQREASVVLGREVKVAAPQGEHMANRIRLSVPPTVDRSSATLYP